MSHRSMSQATCLPRVVLLMVAFIALGATWGPRLAYAQVAGSFDTSFDGPTGTGNGRVVDLTVSAGNHLVFDHLVQPDGKLVIAGSCSAGGIAHMCVVRLNINGTLDTSFGPLADGKHLLTGSISLGFASRVLRRPDGRLVLAGKCQGNNVCVAGLTADGLLDTSFGASGYALMSPPASAFFGAGSALLQPDGAVVVVGRCQPAAITQICAFRFTVSGSPDPTFGTSGTVLVPAIGNGGDDRPANAAVLQPDGKIVMAGYCHSTTTGRDFCIVRLNANGTLDAAFDGPGGSGNGAVAIPVSTGAGHDEAADLALQPDGRLLVAGRCDRLGSQDFCVVRLNANGSFDTQFDGEGSADGVVVVSAAGTDTVTAMALQTDGRIVIAGTCTSSLAPFCVVRLNSDGSLDTSFDSTSNANGRITFTMPNASSTPQTVSVQANGRIVMSGQCSNGSITTFCAVRLNGGSSGGAACSPDVDGNGKFDAAIDGLILTRAMLGVSGAALLNGISFPSPAPPRNTYALIRDYLTAHCGMVLPP